MSAAPVPVRFHVDPWDPAYGVAVDVDDLEPSKGDVEVEIELPAQQWRPIEPRPEIPPAASVLFVDGVRRIDAHIWMDGVGTTSAAPEPETSVLPAAGDVVHSGICASFAAGAVICDRLSARLVAASVGRGIFSASPAAEPLVTSAGVYEVHMTAGSLPAQLSLGLQDAMGRLEVSVAERASATESCELVVVDGPLRRRDHIAGAVGLVKTHHVAYLPVEQHRVVSALGAGQRTPLFVLGTSWNRYSWYMRLPGGAPAPWSGVVRCECSADLAPDAAQAVADRCTCTLPRFASEPYKDPRAPQNLYPIGGLENTLRRRLGDRDLLYRSLRAAAHASGR